MSCRRCGETGYIAKYKHVEGGSSSVKANISTLFYLYIFPKESIVNENHIHKL